MKFPHDFAKRICLVFTFMKINFLKKGNRRLRFFFHLNDKQFQQMYLFTLILCENFHFICTRRCNKNYYWCFSGFTMRKLTTPNQASFKTTIRCISSWCIICGGYRLKMCLPSLTLFSLSKLNRNNSDTLFPVMW